MSEKDEGYVIPEFYCTVRKKDVPEDTCRWCTLDCPKAQGKGKLSVEVVDGANWDSEIPETEHSERAKYLLGIGYPNVAMPTGIIALGDDVMQVDDDDDDEPVVYGVRKEELIAALKRLPSSVGDEEDWHIAADGLILMYIDDADIAKAFWAIPKWYK